MGATTGRPGRGGRFAIVDQIVQVALIAPVIGAGVTMGALVLQRQFSRTDAAAAEKRDVRHRTAAVVGPLRALVNEAAPDPLGITANRSLAVMDDLLARWIDLRLELSVVALTHPSPEVRGVMEAVTVAVPHSLHETRWWVFDIVEGQGDIATGRSAANSEYTTAHDLVELLADAVTGRLSGNELETRRAEIARASEHEIVDETAENGG